MFFYYIGQTFMQADEIAETVQKLKTGKIIDFGLSNF
jgi:predicted oxidoreductase